MHFISKHNVKCKMEYVAYERDPRKTDTSSELLYDGQADKAPASFGAPIALDPIP